MEVTQIDIKNVCRTCMLSSGDLEVIFSSYFGEILISQVLFEVGKVQILIDDGLSNFICQNCKQTAINAYRFQQMCIESDRTLRILAGNCDQDISEMGGVPKDEESSLSQDLLIENDKINDEEILLDELNDSIIYEAVESDDSEDPDMGEEEMMAEEESSEESDSAEVVYGCSQCPKFFKTSEKLEKHIKKHEASKKDQSESDTSEETRHVCKDCGREYKTKALVARHRKAAHGGPRRLEVCLKCDKRFPSIAALTRHQIIHSDLVERSKIARDDSQEFICVICAQSFKNCETMATHMKGHRAKTADEQNHTCKLCHESFPTLSDILRHAKNHIENATHQCTICNKLFAMGDELIDHFLRHKGNFGIFLNVFLS